MKTALALGHSRGRFLYELRPDLFPGGFLTNDEMFLWGLYHDDLDTKTKQNRKGRR